MEKKKVVKVILVILLLVVVIFLINTFRKFFILEEIQKSGEEYFSSMNYYMKEVISNSNNVAMTIEMYRKNAKFLVETNSNVTNEKKSIYGNGTRTDEFTETKEGKTAKLDSKSTIGENSIPNYLETENSYRTFCASLFSKVKEVEHNGKKCYLVTGNLSSVFLNTSSDEKEIYVEKDTGLCIKVVLDKNIIEFEYEFDNVEDEVFVEPDISQYELIRE